jgi:hypothetical protein
MMNLIKILLWLLIFSGPRGLLWACDKDHGKNHQHHHDHIPKPKTTPLIAKMMIEKTGELQGPMMAIGGETAPFVLKTPEGDYELLSSQVKLQESLPALSGKKIWVKGQLQQIFSVERGKRRVINITDLKSL